MDDRNYTAGFIVDRSPAEVVDAVADVRRWWMTEADGSAARVGDEFGFSVPGVHTTRIRVEAIEPGRLVSWRVLENDMSFVTDQSEWVGTEIRFEIDQTDAGTRMRFAHVGLVPEYECFDICRQAWDRYIDSLRDLLLTGTGTPTTAAEERGEGAELGVDVGVV